MVEQKLSMRLMLETDVQKVAEIERQCFTTPWTEDGFLDGLRQKYTCFVVAETQTGEIAGYCGLYQSEQTADITNVAVSVTFRRQGLARSLLERLMAYGAERGIVEYTLEVRVTNMAAIALYQKLGFVAEGRRKNFYRNPTEDALIMWRHKT